MLGSAGAPKLFKNKFGKFNFFTYLCSEIKNNFIMGQLVYILSKSKEEKDLELLNESLHKIGISNSFNTEKGNQEWLDDINNRQDSPQSHLKPKSGNLSMSELMKIFPSWTRIGELSFDVAFGRTSDEEALLYGNFILENQEKLTLKNGEELISRYPITPEIIKVINEINVPDSEPEMLPIDEQNKPELECGILLCKSFSPEPFWVIYGRVDTPAFLKTKIYKNDIHNRIYRDKEKRAYMMIPLMPINNDISNFSYETYDKAWGIGLREHPNYFLPLVYRLEIKDPAVTANDFEEFYSDIELIERYHYVISRINSMKPYYTQLRWVKGEFHLLGDCTSLTYLILLLNSIAKAIIKKQGRQEFESKLVTF
jgi:hypothetical protein